MSDMKQHLTQLKRKTAKGAEQKKKQMLINGKLGVNVCTEFAKALVEG